jgi:DHA1 family bicyclomycin/chloramphenicol resistance-like MFS transporter
LTQNTAVTSFTEKKPKPEATWLLVLITSTSTLALSIIAPSLPGIGESFSVTPESVQRVLTVYLLMLGLGQLIFGPVSDRFGRRLTLLVGLGLYLLGSVLASFAPNLEFLVLARLIQGLGASAAMVLPRVIINDTHQPRAAAASLAAVTAAMQITPMLSFPLGGLLFEFFGWRGSMVVTAVLGVVTIVSVLTLLQETNNARQQSLRLVSVAVDYLSLTKNKQFLLFAVIAAAPPAIFFAFLNFFPFAFKNLGYSASEFGYFIMLLPTTFVVGNLISRKLTPTLGITKMVQMGSLIIVAGIGVMAGLVFLGFESAWGLVLPGMVYSLGAGFSQSNATMGAINAVGQSVRGLGGGLAGSLQMLLSSGIAASTIFLGAAEDTRIGVGILLLVAIASLIATLFMAKDSEDT